MYPSGVVGHINIRKRVNVLKMDMLFNSALDSREFAKENERFSLKYSFFSCSTVFLNSKQAKYSTLGYWIIYQAVE